MSIEEEKKKEKKKRVKLIIAGSRHFEEDIVYAEPVKIRITDHPMAGATEIVSGKAKGVDSAGEAYAEFYVDGKVKEFPAEWDKYKGRAGPIRNNKMAVYADACFSYGMENLLDLRT
ncbi:MAG: DUF2493 domain-containing protein [Leptolyngbyaceae cyanobacterium RM2_2_4]|nr:DUF2493 domain-containing protein [Leptolyngbyaceae cyanobacterium RM2_2_4]